MELDAGVRDPEALMVAASEATGLSDFGDENFPRSLERYVDAVNAEANLNEMGVAFQEAHIHRLLVNRLRLENDVKVHPEILEEEVTNPIVITGMLRTGTTKLQRMMSSEPGVQGLSSWRLLNPAPLSSGPPGGPDERIDIALGYEEQLRQLCPDLMTAHPFRANDVEEDSYLLILSFESHPGAMGMPAPSYLLDTATRPQQPVYEYLHRVLQYLQWQGRGTPDQPWVLKSPYHLGCASTILKVFPGATIVHCHRDPCVAVPSTARLIEEQWKLFTDEIDLNELGDLMLRYLSGEMAKNLLQREDQSIAGRILDVHYRDIVDHPLDVIRAAYQAHGRELDSSGAKHMVAWEKENPQHLFGKNVYSLERYGLTQAQIAESFGSYAERLDLEW